jgi:hypothetical protein
MSSDFAPHWEILPAPQRALWHRLRELPDHFVLYGGTALALRLGHRASLDFDFFSNTPFDPEDLYHSLDCLKSGAIIQNQANTLSVSVPMPDPVKVSFFGGLTLGRVGVPDKADNHLPWIASLPDLAGCKAAVLPKRAEAKDYLDLDALLQAGHTIPEILGAACAIYGGQFNPMLTLKALAYYEDGDLPSLPSGVKARLTKAAQNMSAIPSVARLSDRINA